MYITATSTM